MTPAELTEIGRALYGDDWKSPLGRALGVAYKTVHRWSSGDFPIPDEVAEQLLEFAGRDRAKQALDLIADLQRAEGPPVEIRLTQGRDAVGRRATRILADALKAIGVKVEIVTVEGGDADPAERAKRAATAKR